MSKKFLSLIMSFVFLVTTFLKIPVFAEGIFYIDADGNKQITESAIQLNTETKTLTGWYYMSGNLETETRFEVSGEAHLILCDGCNLNCQGIRVAENNNLTIYGQAQGNGIFKSKLSEGDAAIGGNDSENSGVIQINGGTINAMANMGAGIGGGIAGNGSNITINGGTINAMAGSGAGIGGGRVGNGSNITINGGTVNAIGNTSGSGIGGGDHGNGSNITINGGTVKVGSLEGAGIGNGWEGSGSTGFYTELEGKKGTAFIEADSITDITDQSEKENWTGIFHFIDDKSWIIKGNPICNQNITFKNDETINFDNNAILTQTGELTNNDIIDIPSDIKIICNNTFTNNNKIIINGILSVTGQVNWNSIDVTGSGEIMPESAKIPVTFTVPDLNLDKIYDGKPINIDEENLKTSCSYSAYGKEGAGDITIVHKKDGKTLSSAPSNCGKYSLVISAESSRFYQGNTKIFDYEIKELPKEVNSSDEELPNKIDFSYLEPNNNNQTNETQSKIIFTAYNSKESIKIPNGKTKKIRYDDKIVNITPTKTNDILEVEIKDENGNELNVGGKIILIAPQDICKPGTVAVTSNGKVVRKSIAKDGKLYLPLKSSETYKIFDNKKIFFDVSNHWANDAIDFASGYELFNGTASNIFEPEMSMSRAMIVQVLHNLEDNPYQIFEKIFDDVNFDNWFAEAVTWASKNNFVLGYDDKNFGPNDNITREQLATILYRYFGENEIVDIDLNFADTNQISDYALKALRWAIANKILKGKGNNILDPKALATRAEVTQMFQNLMFNLFYR